MHGINILGASVVMQDTCFTPPSIDAIAARRWRRNAPLETPWLHDEVARRMAERLAWIKLEPRSWLHWDALRGSAAAHGLLNNRYPKALSYAPLPEHAPCAYASVLHRTVDTPWWQAKRWLQPQTQIESVPATGVDMLWSNMAMHLSADPVGLVSSWHNLLQTDGFLMFSCLGPDTLIELRQVYAQMGWPEPSHAFTDMHDYGDMLVQAGFAEPVMDMERITLTFASPQRLLQELRGLGRNMHIHRFQGLRGRRWHQDLLQALSASWPAQSQGDGASLSLTFEVIYGHALKPAPRLKVSEHSAISLRDMKAMLGSRG
jgi:malonyl-CoA O-methyltransferase